MKNCERVDLASNSYHKLKGANDGFKAALHRKEIDVRVFDIQPEGNAQAYGDKEILEQALDRLNKLKAKLGEKTRNSILVAIQSGVISVELEGKKRWLDVSWVVIEDEEGELHFGSSSGIEFDAEDVAKAQEGKGFEENTIGAARAKRLGGEATDPHSSSTAGAVSRAETIQITIESVLGQMMYKKGISPETREPETLELTQYNARHEPEVELPVLVGSKSNKKVDPAGMARDRVFTNVSGVVEGRSASSGINEQPEGNKETLEGALNREKCIKQETEKMRAATIAIESGEIPIEIQGEERYFDFAWVVATDPSGRNYLARSSGVEFDKKYVNLARKKGFETTTIGSVIAEESEREGGEVDGTDPQKTLTNFLVSRRRSLEHACRIIFGQMRVAMSRS